MSLADSDPDVGMRVKAIESVVLAMSGHTNTGTGNTRAANPMDQPQSVNLFNKKRRWFRRSKFHDLWRGQAGH